MKVYHAVYLEKDQKSRPDAIFASEQDALQWGFDHAMEYVGFFSVEILPTCITLATESVHEVTREGWVY